LASPSSQYSTQESFAQFVQLLDATLSGFLSDLKNGTSVSLNNTGLEASLINCKIILLFPFAWNLISVFDSSSLDDGSSSSSLTVDGITVTIPQELYNNVPGLSLSAVAYEPSVYSFNGNTDK
jgi:hypothetical protein